MEKRRSGVVSCFTTDWVIDETFNTSNVAQSSLSFLLFSFGNLEDVTLRMQCLYLLVAYLRYDSPGTFGAALRITRTENRRLPGYKWPPAHSEIYSLPSKYLYHDLSHNHQISYQSDNHYREQTATLATHSNQDALINHDSQPSTNFYPPHFGPFV